jgi:hydrogenase small subunit
VSISRRDFIRAAAAIAGAFGLRVINADGKEANDKGSPVIWLQAQGCTGCSASLLNSITCGTVESLLRSQIDLKFHPTLMAAAGPNAVAAAYAAKSAGTYLLVVEGAIPTRADGRYCYLWPGTTALSGIREFAAEAQSILAVGTCAAFGGIAASVPPRGANPTGAKSVSAIVTGKTIVNVPGCPPHPDWIVGTIAQLLQGTVPATDGHGRPEEYFSNTIHNQCPYEDGFAEEYCLEDYGCKGAITHGNCPSLKWNGVEPGRVGVNWCVGAGSPCHGCTHPGFPDGVLPFHAEIED